MRTHQDEGGAVGIAEYGDRESRWHVEGLLSAASLTHSGLAEAVGRFDGDPAAMMAAAVRTAERAFAELNDCDDIVDEAGETAGSIAYQLRELLAAEAVSEVRAQLDLLDAAVARVRATYQTRALLNRLLGHEEVTALVSPPVTRITKEELPALPSAYRDEAGFEDLMAMAAREDELAPRLRAAHAERIRVVSTHLVRVIRTAAEAGFSDEQSAHDAVDETRRAYELWLECLSERKRDLG
ncbi:hypothetical protein ACFYXL_22070 [Streptomyces tsukubensis]|uniref:hypothetical protein n=1 Tax=Streptomyces tsukubensis TaxID=83656 RepID=UPI0036B01A81